LLCIPRLKSKKTAQFNNLNIVLNRFLNSFMTNARFFWVEKEQETGTGTGSGPGTGPGAGDRVRNRKKIVLICWIWS
jgi:hypothetical protein